MLGVLYGALSHSAAHPCATCRLLRSISLHRGNAGQAECRRNRRLHLDLRSLRPLRTEWLYGFPASRVPPYQTSSSGLGYRSEGRRVGEEWVSKCRFGGLPVHSKKNNKDKKINR